MLTAKYSNLLLVTCTVLLLALLPTSPEAQTDAPRQPQPRIHYPIDWSQLVIDDISAKRFSAAATQIIRAIQASPTQSKLLEARLSELPISDKPFNKLAEDKNYNNVIREMIYYQFNEGSVTPFLYYRFVFKITPNGWVLSNFHFKPENGQPFPLDWK
jgi:hypothetical protein